MINNKLDSRLMVKTSSRTPIIQMKWRNSWKVTIEIVKMMRVKNSTYTALNSLSKKSWIFFSFGLTENQVLKLSIIRRKTTSSMKILPTTIKIHNRNKLIRILMSRKINLTLMRPICLI